MRGGGEGEEEEGVTSGQASQRMATSFATNGYKQTENGGGKGTCATPIAISTAPTKRIMPLSLQQSFTKLGIGEGIA
eukprot:490242-Rhodomonas_salina.2